jgi:hypothetical protein
MRDEDLIWGTPEALDEDLEKLQRSHTGWSERIFMLRAIDRYRELDHARRKGHPDNLEDDLTSACLEGLRGEKRPIDIPIDLQGAQIAAIKQEGEFDVIDVRFVGERLRDGIGPGEVIDILRFSRYRFEHTTDSETGLTESCPRCGGEIDATTDWRCRFCDALINEQSSGWRIERVMDFRNYAQ